MDSIEDYINEYTGSFELSNNLRLKNTIRELINMVNEYFGGRIKDIFITNIENLDEENLQEMWLFVENIWFKLNITDETHKIQIIKPRNINKFELEKKPRNPSLS